MTIPASVLTHLAFEVDDLDRSLGFYARYTRLRVMHERQEDSGTRVAWLREPERPNSLVLVLVGNAERPERRSPFAHLGLAVDSPDEVDAIAAIARADGVLAFGPQHLGPIVGYIVQVSDPDGNLLEFSHGQVL